MNITVVLGTARTGRVSEHVARLIEQELTTSNQTVTFVDVRDHVKDIATLPPWGEGGANTNPTEWKAIVEKTDAFIMVVPEYNHSFPGEWKLLMDSLFPEYKGKRCYVAAVSNGSFGGARVMEHILSVLVNFQFIIGNARLHIFQSDKIFTEAGELTDEQTAARVKKFVSSIIDNS